MENQFLRRNALFAKLLIEKPSCGWYLAARDEQRHGVYKSLIYFGMKDAHGDIWGTDFMPAFYGPFPSPDSCRNGLALLCPVLILSIAEEPLVSCNKAWRIFGEHLPLRKWAEWWRENGASQPYTFGDKRVFDVPDPLAEPHPIPASPLD